MLRDKCPECETSNYPKGLDLVYTLGRMGTEEYLQEYNLKEEDVEGNRSMHKMYLRIHCPNCNYHSVRIQQSYGEICTSCGLCYCCVI